MIDTKIPVDVSPVFMKNWEAIESGLYRYLLNEGSSRSSKTYSMIDVYDLKARSLSNKRMTIWRDTHKDCVDTVYNDYQRHLRATGRLNHEQILNKTKNFAAYRSGSTIETYGADDLASVHGLTQDWAWLNEPYKISKDIFDQIDQRTSDIIMLDWNPRMAHWMDDLKKDPRTIVIKSTFRDNPFCPVGQRNKILSYQPVKNCFLVENKFLTVDEANKYDLVANKWNFERRHLKELERCRLNEYKRSASEYKWAVYGLGNKAEKPNRIFRWEEIALSEYNNLDVPEYCATDWGAVDPWAILKFKYYDGGLYLHELNYSSENFIRENMTTTERHQIEGADEGLVTWMFNKLEIPYNMEIVCDNNRKAKIAALRACGWDYAIGVQKNKNSIIDGVDRLKGLRVYYTHTSDNIRYEQENYSYKEDKYQTVLEEPEDANNHCMDAARYGGQLLQDLGVIRKI